jgi:hypothetical protein
VNALNKARLMILMVWACLLVVYAGMALPVGPSDGWL